MDFKIDELLESLIIVLMETVCLYATIKNIINIKLTTKKKIFVKERIVFVLIIKFKSNMFTY